ncbi:MAG: hypothetical protein QOK43_1532 [Acidimicrobiaceae bacterium]|nr:hypothetical protein [Acidimicrobiaceae bacterium]
MSEVLASHLATWLGTWPPPAPGQVTVVGSLARTRPGWDGNVRAVLGVVAPEGGVVSVPPAVAEGLSRVVAPDVAAAGRLLGVKLWEAAFRWCESPAPLPDTGVWISPDDTRVPEWLKPFNGGVLIVLEDDGYVAGVGVKRHDDFGWELSVGTEPAAQGRGLARALVATAARRVLAESAVPTYLHDFRNLASAKVAEAAGFPDRGWRVVGVASSG